MDNNTANFINYLHRGGEYGHYWYKNSDGAYRQTIWFKAGSPPHPTGNPTNVYFGVNPTRIIPPINSKGEPKQPHQVRSQNEHVCAINCLYGDFDAKDHNGNKKAMWEHIKRLIVPPSVIIDSGGGYHCYWLLDETLYDMERAAEYLTRWVYFVGADKNVHDLARILRVPGTYNRKPEYAPDFPQVVFVEYDLARVYALDDLVKLLPEPEPELEKASAPPQPVNASDQDLLNAMFSNPTNGAAIKALFDGDTSACGGDHSAADQALCNHLAYYTGNDAGRIDRLFRLSELMRDKWEKRPHDYAKPTIEKAMAVTSTFYVPYLGNDVDEPVFDDTQDTQTEEHDAASVQDQKAGCGFVSFTPDIIPPIVDGETIKAAKTTDATLNFLLSQSADDEGNAQCVKTLYGDRILYCDAYGWMTYSGRYWKRQNEGAVDRAIVATLKKRRVAAVTADKESLVRATLGSAARVKGCKYLLRSLQMTDVATFDKSQDLLNCQNGVVDLRTGDLVPHDSSQRFTYCVPTEYHPQAFSEEWEQFLIDVLDGDAKLVRYIQTAIGYSLTGHTWEECLFYVHGPTRSGKGTFTETLLTALGREPMATEVDFTSFTMDRGRDAQNFDLAPLKPCRFVAASESTRYQRLNAAKVKQITGGNDIRCAFKHKDHFSYRPQFKIWLSSNWPVNADVDDGAIWGRVRVIEFPNSYLGREDKRLKTRLTTPESLRGVLAWAIRGALDWYGRGAKGLDIPPQVQAATDAARNDIDYVGQWLDECVNITDNPDNFVINKTLYASYSTWCSNAGIEHAKSQRGLTISLKNKGLLAGERGDTGRGCRSITLKTAPLTLGA